MKLTDIMAAIVVVAAVSGCSSKSTTTMAQLCDENANRYATMEEARAAGLSDAEFGATFCPEYKMHPSWDTNNDGINDCENDGSCNANSDYMSPRPLQ
jgi:hypothetical protein